MNQRQDVSDVRKAGGNQETVDFLRVDHSSEIASSERSENVVCSDSRYRTRSSDNARGERQRSGSGEALRSAGLPYHKATLWRKHPPGYSTPDCP